MYRGTVTFLDEVKGLGVIVDDSSNEELPVYFTGLVDNIREGDSVTFDTEDGSDGKRAINVTLA
jgi:CspA family cold shock protein